MENKEAPTTVENQALTAEQVQELVTTAIAQATETITSQFNEKMDKLHNEEWYKKRKQQGDGHHIDEDAIVNKVITQFSAKQEEDTVLHKYADSADAIKKIKNAHPTLSREQAAQLAQGKVVYRMDGRTPSTQYQVSTITQAEYAKLPPNEREQMLQKIRNKEVSIVA